MSGNYSTLESNDRALFDRIALQYCKKDLSPVSSPARQLRLKQTFKLVRGEHRQCILEIGCGAGFSARYLEGSYKQYVGLDYSKELIACALKHNASAAASFVLAKAEEFDDATRFDVILLVGVLHHLDNVSETMRHLVGLLKPGGIILANEPQPGNRLITLARAVRKIVDSNYSADQTEFSLDELRRIFLSAGLSRVEFRAQGLLSTVFAEVILPFNFISVPLSKIACAFDRWVEDSWHRKMTGISWNLAVCGMRPKLDDV